MKIQIPSEISYIPAVSAPVVGYPYRIDQFTTSAAIDTPSDNPRFVHKPAVPFAELAFEALNEITLDIKRLPDATESVLFESDESGNISGGNFSRYDLSDITLNVARLLLKHSLILSDQGSRLFISNQSFTGEEPSQNIPHIDALSTMVADKETVIGLLAYPSNTLTYGGVITDTYVNVIETNGNVVAARRAKIMEDMYATPEGQMNLYSEQHTIRAAQRVPGIFLQLSPILRLSAPK